MALDLEYMTGFGNEFETEALPGALPKGQFSPQKVKYDLYAEQLMSRLLPHRAVITAATGFIAFVHQWFKVSMKQ